MLRLLNYTGIALQLVGLLVVLAGIVISSTLSQSLYTFLFQWWLSLDVQNYTRTATFPGLTVVSLPLIAIGICAGLPLVGLGGICRAQAHIARSSDRAAAFLEALTARRKPSA